MFYPYLEQQTATGPSPRYDYKGAAELFLKVTAFKKATFRIAETSLSVEQIKAAGKALIGMGVTGTPESGNAIAGAVQALGEALKAGITEARAHADRGLPVGHDLLNGEAALTKAITAKDPTTSVCEFLAEQTRWKALYDGIEALRTFIEAKRMDELISSRRLVELARNHPVPDGQAGKTPLEQAESDMDAIIANKAVIERWTDYRSAYEQARDAYRAAYLDVYDDVRSKAEALRTEITEGGAYFDAPSPERDQVLDKVFGVGRPCNYPSLSSPTTALSTQALLDACAKHSLTALQQAELALPAYRAQVEAELHDLVEPSPPPDETWEWHPYSDFAGKRFATTAEVDEALAALGDALKARISEGRVVVVK